VRTPEEQVRRLLYQVLIEAETKPLTDEEKLYLDKSVKLPEIRKLMTDFFLGFSSPTLLHSDCFMVLGSMCRALLDILTDDTPSCLNALHSLMHAG
jgi:hypothetical protein